MATLQAVVIISSALAAAYFGLKLCNGIGDRRQRLRVAALCSLCLALMSGIGGLISVHRITRSARPSIQGTITALRQTAGRSPQSHFDVLTADGRTIKLQMEYHGAQLTRGEMVAVTYLAEYGAVLQLKIIDGPYG